MTVFLVAFTNLPKAMAAQEQDWYSANKPLIAWHNNVKHSLAYGTSYRSEAYLKNHTYYKDPRPGGNKVFTATEYSYYGPDYVLGESWTQRINEDRSEPDNSGTWVDQYDQDYLGGAVRAQDSKGRVWSRTCVDRPDAPDYCSDFTYKTFEL